MIKKCPPQADVLSGVSPVDGVKHHRSHGRANVIPFPLSIGELLLMSSERMTRGDEGAWVPCDSWFRDTMVSPVHPLNSHRTRSLR